MGDKQKKERRVPKLRFPEFTDEWEQRKLGDICESFEYGLNAAAKEYDGENKYIRITDIDDNSREFLQENVTSPDTELAGAENYCLKYGDILFARTGASVGKTYIYKDSDGLVYYAGFLIRGRVKDGFAPEFVFQNTLTEDYEKFIRITSQRSGQPGVNAQEYAGYKIFMPTYEEQKKIGRYFSNLDALITLQKCKCDETKVLKKYMLQKMFPNDGMNVPEIRFAGFTNTWEQRKLIEEVSSIDTGKSKFTVSESGNYEILGSTSVIGYDDSYDYEGDFLLTARVGANAGELYRHSGKVKISDNTVFIQGKQLDFIYYALLNFDIKKLSFGTGQPLVKASELKEQNITMPVSEDERQKIGIYFRRLDRLITLHQCKLTHLKELKKGLLQQMFV